MLAKIRIAVLFVLALNVLGVTLGSAEQDPLPGCFPCSAVSTTAR